MAVRYKLTPYDHILFWDEGAVVPTGIPIDERSPYYQRYLAWVAAGNTAEAADPLPELGPTRDERLLAAVEQAKTAVSESGAFTPQQETILVGVFDGLGQAITGD